MPELEIRVVDVTPARHAVAPTLCFRLAVSQVATPVSIRGVTLQCQIRIDARRRVYKPAEKARLTDLFGEPERWSQTLQSMLWTHTTLGIPGFDADCTVELAVPCSFDFNIAATKYFHGLEFDKVPLLLLFSGSVFYTDDEGALAMDLIGWNKEARYRLPIATWQDMMDRYYPNSAWLCVNRQVFEALYAYKRQHGCTGFDEALARLLPQPDKALAS